jgi:hypothetical protein
VNVRTEMSRSRYKKVAEGDRFSTFRGRLSGLLVGLAVERLTALGEPRSTDEGPAHSQYGDPDGRKSFDQKLVLQHLMVSLYIHKHPLVWRLTPSDKMI